MLNNTIVLFDMDGTLSPSRQPVDPEELLGPMVELAFYADIGIVTGSGLNYIKEQISCLLKHPLLKNLHILPCNGTQYYDADMNLKTESDMRTHLGPDDYELVVRTALALQAEIAAKYPIPLTGHFLDFRSSMLNWCPSGRDAQPHDREKFKRMDKQWRIRQRYLTEFLEQVPVDIVAALGGETSIDVYPPGWDKTYALNHFPGAQVYFVGDKCVGSGNDRTICEAVAGRCYPTSGPEETVRIIQQHLIPLLSEGGKAKH
tara:strand:+ start:304 stop:1083 length:780 start_codon:yes stop_codon:yes gene_type:complete